MLTIGLIDHDIMLRFGITILLNGYFKKLKISKSESTDEFLKAHLLRAPDLVILGTNHKTVTNSVRSIKKLKSQFPDIRIILYWNNNLDLNSAISCFKIGINGQMLKKNIPTELIDCIKAVQHNRKYLCTELSKTLLGSLREESNSDRLSRRESEVAFLLSQGKTVAWIAESLNKQPSTISTVKSNIFRKLDVDSVAQLSRALSLERQTELIS